MNLLKRERFYFSSGRFYKEEMIINAPEPTDSGRVLAAMEQAGKLQGGISRNIYEFSQGAGCKNVIDIYGKIYDK